jgi:hypothetical protein
MKRTTDESALMIRYLLGDVSEDEQVRLEERFFVDDQSYQQLVALEDELRYDYAQGTLNPRQRGLFEKRFLTAPAEQKKVELAKAVLLKTREEAARLKAEPETERSWWQAFAGFVTLRPMPLATAAAALCAVAFFSETVHLRRELNQLEIHSGEQQKAAQVAMNQQKALGDARSRELQQERNRREQLEQDAARPKPAAAPLVLAFALSPGLVRDAVGSKRLRIPPDADSVKLKLDLKAADRSAELRASLQNLDNQELWSQDVRATAAGVVLTLPARVLAPGDYVIELKSRAAVEEPVRAGEYYFTVVQ